MLAKGLIQESSSAAASPVLFVPKAGGKLRLCMDFRRLNLISIKDRYPILSTDMLLNQLSRAKIYTKLNLRSAYHRMRVAEGHEWKTAFCTRYGLFEYLVMPFGLTNAPGVFQRLVNKVLRKFIDRFVIVYLDDILIYSDNLKEHDAHVHLVLKELRVNKLYAKPEKCKFNTNIVEYLGFKVTLGGVTSDPVKIERVVKWTAPQSVKQLQGFLGFCNFYRRFVRNFSKVVSPVNHLLKKNVRWTWSRDCNKAFELLKAKFTLHPVLRHFQPEHPTRVELDASNIGIAAVLMQQQEDNKQYHPLAFVSRTSSLPKRNYKVHNREMLAIKYATEQWRPMLRSCADGFDVLTDNVSCKYFMTTKVLNQRQVRWGQTTCRFQLLPDLPTGEVKQPGGRSLLSGRQGSRGGRSFPARITAPPHLFPAAPPPPLNGSAVCGGHPT